MNLNTFFNSQHIRVAAVGSLGIKFSSAAFAFINSILLARILGVEYFGIYILAFTTVMLITVPVSLGLPTLLTRYVSKYEIEGNFQAIKGLLIRSNQMVLFTTLFVLFIAYISYLLWWNKYDTILVEAIWYSLILVPLLALGSLRAGTLRGLRFIVLGQLPDTFLRNILLFIGLGYFFLNNSTLLPKEAMYIHIGAAIVAFIVGHLFLRSKLLLSIKHLVPTFHTREWVKQALPFSLNSGVQIVKAKFITYVLAVFGSIEAVAIFEIAMRAATLVAFTLDGLNTAIAPFISTAFEKANMESLQKIVTKTSRIIFVFALPVVLIFILGGEQLIALLYGTEYIASYIPLLILCAGQLVNAITGSVGLVLNMTGNQAYFTRILFVVTIINVLLSIPLVIYYDVLGAAILYSVLLIIQNVLLVIYVQKKLKINTTVF